MARHGFSGVLAVVGLGWGDEGKGSWVDYLVRQTQAPWVARFNGGPQAAHHVVTPTGQTHCFAQWGSGTLVPGVRTWLAQPMWVDPLALSKEQQALHRLGITDAYARLTIDPRCGIVTPFHTSLNRLRETLRGADRHGSCGMGVGEAWHDSQRGTGPVLRWQDLRAPKLAQQLAQIQADKIAQAEALLQAAPAIAPAAQTYLHELQLPHLPHWLADYYRQMACNSGINTAGPECLHPALEAGQTLIFEGAQGVLLDKDYGFSPYITPSSTTFASARAVLAELPAVPLYRLGVLRAYSIRHGAGPLVTEDAALTAALPEPHNGQSVWQGAVRLGWFDAVAAHYALQVSGGIDHLLLTQLDRLTGRTRIPVCTAYHNTAGQPITLQTPQTPKQQRQLTQQLAHCLPHYQQVVGWNDVAQVPTGYGAFLADELHVTLGGLSYGPTATTKQLFFKS